MVILFLQHHSLQGLNVPHYLDTLDEIIRPCIQDFISGYLFCSTEWHICLYASQLPQWLSRWRICLHCRRHRRCGSIHGLRRSPGEGNGNPVQYSCLRNPLDRGAWWATVQKVTKSQEDWVTKHTFLPNLYSFGSCTFVACSEIRGLQLCCSL